MTTPTKPNALSAFINDTPASASPVPQKLAGKAAKAAKAEATPKGEGQSADGKSFPFRLSGEDHRALKMLAARDEISMQAMIFEAVKAYAGERGVKLKG